MASRQLPEGFKGPRSPEQAAAWLTANGLPKSGSTVRRLVESGEIKATKTSDKKGAWVRIELRELRRYLRNNT